MLGGDDGIAPPPPHAGGVHERRRLETLGRPHLQHWRGWGLFDVAMRRPQTPAPRRTRGGAIVTSPGNGRTPVAEDNSTVSTWAEVERDHGAHQLSMAHADVLQ
jgi:hypothetical protein